MATAVKIDITNSTTHLVQSTQSRTGIPDGNIYFDTANSLIELITAEDEPNVDLGSGSEANPLTDFDGITMQAIYAFMVQERAADSIRSFEAPSKGVYKDAGAFEFINGWKLDDVNGNAPDRSKIRDSGFIERADDSDNSIDRVYHGVLSLNDIGASSQAYYMIADTLSDTDKQAAAPVDFARLGPVNEVVQVFGTTANTPSDAGAGDFDFINKVSVPSIRTWGENYGRSDSLAAGKTRLYGLSVGYGLGETANAANAYTLADVFGGAQTAPWTSMGLEVFGVDESRSGFVSGSADFDIIISNGAAGSLQEIRAFMDALSLQDTDIDDGAGTLLGKRRDVLYTINGEGKLVTAQGVHLDGVPVADQQSIIQTDVLGVGQVYPFLVQVEVEVGAGAVADSNAWYQAFYTDGASTADFDTVGAVTVQDNAPADVKGVVNTDATGTKIIFTYDYDANTQAGLSAGVDKDVTFLCEGDGGVTQAIAQFTITRSAIVSASAVPPAENNL